MNRAVARNVVRLGSYVWGRTFGSEAAHAERDLFPYWPATWKKAARWLFPLAALAVLTESRLLCASGTRAKPGLVPEGKADLSRTAELWGY